MTVQTQNATTDPRTGIPTGILATNWPTSKPSLPVDAQESTTVHPVFTDTERPPVKWSTQIWDLGDAGYYLNYPVMIVVEEYPDEEIVAARFPEVEAYGEGQTEPEAILRLKCSILDLFVELNEADPESLGELPQSWLRVLNRLIAKL